jgi:hypothetical protein
VTVIPCERDPWLRAQIESFAEVLIRRGGGVLHASEIAAIQRV